MAFLSENSKFELIAFRFMLACWIASAILTVCYGYSIYTRGLHEALQPKALEWTQGCSLEAVRRFDSITRPIDGFVPDYRWDAAQKGMEDDFKRCEDPMDPRTLDYLGAKIKWWHHLGGLFRGWAIALFVGSTLLFYCTRWVTTGKIRPFWLKRF
jgi:hypothetical protein